MSYASFANEMRNIHTVAKLQEAYNNFVQPRSNENNPNTCCVINEQMCDFLFHVCDEACNMPMPNAQRCHILALVAWCYCRIRCATSYRGESYNYNVETITDNFIEVGGEHLVGLFMNRFDNFRINDISVLQCDDLCCHNISRRFHDCKICFP